MGVLVAGAVMLGHGVYQKHAASLTPEKIGLGSGVAACYSSVGASCSGTDVYYAASWDYGYYQTDTPNCATTGDPTVLFGVQDGAGNWVQAPQELVCVNGAGAVIFSGTNNATYYGVVVSSKSGTEFHREAFTAPACNATPPAQPSAIWGSCDAAGGATIAWNAAPGATDYYPRIYTPSGNCSSGWDLASDGRTCYKNTTGGATSVYVGNISANTRYGIWVHSGLPFNSSNPTTAAFTCGVSGSLTVNSCNATPGSPCSAPYSWDSANTPDGVYITATPVGWGSTWTTYSGYSPNSSWISLWPSTYTFKLYDSRSNTLLDAKDVTITQTGGDPGGWLTATNCTIPVGGSTCTSNVSWNITNASARVIQANGGMYGTGRNLDQPGEPSFGSTPSSWTNWGLVIDYNGTTGHDISAAGCLLSGCNTVSDWRYVGTTHVTATCAAGSTWDGSKCAAYPVAPTSLSASCMPSGSQVFLQWPKVSSTAKYYLRVWTPDGVCPGGWTLHTDAHTCYIDSLDPAYHCTGGTCSVSFPTVANQTYSSWVHSGDPVNWNLYATTGNFKCTAPNNLPYGYLDSASCTEAKGWVFDPDNSSANSKLHTYIDLGDPGVMDLGIAVANLPNIDVNNIIGVAGDHGFTISLPASIQNGNTHRITVFGVDNQTGAEKQLTLSPKFVTCANVTTTCTTGADCVSGKCGADSFCTNACPTSQIDARGVCCASGYIVQGGVCTPTCTPACGANASCVGVNICSCSTGYVMVSGVCTAPPSISNFTVSPTRIRPGASTKISWSSVGATSCTVVGQNGYTKSALSKTNDDSGAITSETDFTLTCTNAAGSVSETATVFLLPTYQDQ